MANPSLRETLALPAALCGLMLLVALSTSLHTGVDGSGLFFSYITTAFAVTVLALPIWAAFRLVSLAKLRAEQPLSSIWKQFLERAPLLALPCIVWPLFLAAFTTAKTGIPFIVGFGWDQLWTDFDQLIFGVDPWTVTHQYIGLGGTAWLAFTYTIVWGLVLALSQTFVVLFGSRRLIVTLYSTMLLTWLVGGWLVAFCFSAAGPVFAHLFDPSLQPRFEDLRLSLAMLLPRDSMILGTQNYLASAVQQTVAVKGGGISAMPSMHLGVCSVYVFASRGTRWFHPALILWAVIFIGSIHFGYHYAVDGIVAALIAALCWFAVNRLTVRSTKRAWTTSNPVEVPNRYPAPFVLCETSSKHQLRCREPGQVATKLPMRE